MNISKWLLIAVLLPSVGCDFGKSSDDDDAEDDEEDESSWSNGGGGGSSVGGGSVGGGSMGGGTGSGTTSGGSGTGGTSGGGGTTGSDAATGDSCVLSSSLCIEPNEPDNEAWCAAMEGTYSPEACPDGAFGTCEIPAGGDYTASATAFYYGDFDAEDNCNELEGAYSESSTSDDDEEWDDEGDDHDHEDEDHDHEDEDHEDEDHDHEDEDEDDHSDEGSTGGTTDGGWADDGGWSDDGGTTDGGWADDGGWSDDGGTIDGGWSDDDSTSDESCSFLGGEICIEPNEDDNEYWCDAMGGEYEADGCSPVCTSGQCTLPEGGDFSRPATAFYYGSFDGEEYCYLSGGAYSAIDRPDYCFDGSADGSADASGGYGGTGGGDGSGGGGFDGDDDDWGGDETGGDEGDGSFDVDTLYALWDGVYRDGSPAFGTFIDEDGIETEWENLFSLIWVDYDDYSYSGGSEEYICRLIYNSSGAMEADYSDLVDGEPIYLSYEMDLGALTPEVEGNCEDAALHFGVSDMTEVAEGSAWGFGYGPMTDDFDDELSSALGDEYDSLGDTAGMTYLRWQADGDDRVTAWGFFRVVPFLSPFSSALDIPEDREEIEFVSGVRDSMYPIDGAYYQTSLYILSY